MIQSLQVNIMVSYKNYVTNYNIYTWLEWLGGEFFYIIFISLWGQIFFFFRKDAEATTDLSTKILFNQL